MANSRNRVFISYRRKGTGHVAGRLADRLSVRLPGVEVFMDVDTIRPGENVTDAVSRADLASGTLIAVIGPHWLGALGPRDQDAGGDAHDWVRHEISTALSSSVRVIPVLVDGADMPTADELPEDLRDLASRSALRVDHETFSTDVNRLIYAVTTGGEPSATGSSGRDRRKPPFHLNPSPTG